MTFENAIDSYSSYLDKANTSIPSDTIRNALLLQLLANLSGGGGSIDPATATNQQQLFASFGQFLGENATEAKQDEAISVLNQIVQQGEQTGSVQLSQTAIASSQVQEILPLSGTRKRVRITNHSPTDFILIELNGDADLTQGIIIEPNKTWNSPGTEEARSRLTVISGTGNDVPISYQETSDSVFFVDEPTITGLANILDISYPISIVGATRPLSTLTANLYADGEIGIIQTININSGLIPGATISVVFSTIDGLNGSGQPREFYIELIGVD